MKYVIFSQTPAILSELFNYNLYLDLHRKYIENRETSDLLIKKTQKIQKHSVNIKQKHSVNIKNQCTREKQNKQ